jgi:hypothetical protein
MCTFRLLSPNALDTANCPSTRATSPELTTKSISLEINCILSYKEIL